MSVEALLLGCVLFLLLTIGLGLIRVVRGPSPADRMLSAQLFGTSGVAIFLLLAELRDDPTLRHIALVYALLAAVAVITFVRRGSDENQAPDPDPEERK
ncbi:monovalent cation/H+ antiporter complex subunit F [Desulfurivibrio sp. D14AmB]|uniref:monovalent cation/H+ antiporter complex subunit F n=1 Tax=Desulfurivibrio sp. D14AmB TaxID=3374370 RepID=UPI00376F1E22